MVHGPVRCQFRSHMTPIPASVIYPELPDPLTPGDLQQLFSPSFDERQCAPTVVRAEESQVALLVQLKIFQSIGRFRPATEIPNIAIEYVARRMGVKCPPSQIFPERTLYRHRQAIFKRLGVASWGANALALTKAVMRKTAHARTDPADIINSAIDALIRQVKTPVFFWKLTRINFLTTRDLKHLFVN